MVKKFYSHFTFDDNLTSLIDLDIIAGCNKDEGSYLAEVVDPLFLIKLGYTEIDLK